MTRDEHGHYKAWIAIADVSHYVRPGTLLDDEALTPEVPGPAAQGARAWGARGVGVGDEPRADAALAGAPMGRKVDVGTGALSGIQSGSR